jgi:hypothetical protein
VGIPTPRSGDRLVPRPLDRSAVVLAAVCAVVLTALAVRYHGGHRPGAFDERVYRDLTKLVDDRDTWCSMAADRGGRS